MEDSNIVDACSKLKEDVDKLGVIPALISSLVYVIEQSKETTMSGFWAYISKNTEELFRKVEEDQSILKGRSMLSLRSANEIFQRHLRKSYAAFTDTKMENIKKHLIVTGHEFKNMAVKCRDTIKDLALDFIKDGITILVYGYSKLVEHILLSAAAEKQVRFSVIVAEVRPNCEGYELYSNLKEKIAVVKLIIDANIAYALEKADIVLVGAESVVENGGIINRAGTYMTAMCAKTLKKPFYVVTESYKFTRLFPLSQKDLPDYVVSKEPFKLMKEKASETFSSEEMNEKIQTLNPMCDYTPPDFITLIFTDSGIFTPSAVSDELIQIFNT